MTTTRQALRGGCAILALALALTGCGRNDPAALLESAKAALAKSDPATATIQLKNVLQKTPDNAEARFLLARALLMANDAAGAETELRKAIDLKYPADAAYPMMARALLARGELQKTIALGDRELGEPKARADLAASVALAQLASGNLLLARKFATDAARDAPDEARVLMVQSRIAAADNDLPGATRAIDAALAKNPDDLDAVVFKSQLLGAQGQRDAAVKVLQDSTTAHPAAVPTRFALISLLVSMHRTDDAAAQVAQLKEKSPNDLRTWYAEALLAYAKNQPSQTRDIIQKVLAVNPEHLPSLMLFGLSQLQLGSYAGAEDAFNHVLTRSPDEPNARRSLAAIYIKTGRARQALDLVDPMVRAGSPDPAVYRTAGEAALAAGNLAQASRYFERAGTLDTKDVSTQVRLAQVRMATGEASRAFSDLEVLSSQDSSEYQADLALVSGHLRRREYDAALAAADKLVAKQPNNAMVYTVRGAVQMSKRDAAAARASFEKSLALDPKYYAAAFNLAVLDVREGKPDAAKARYDALLTKDANNEDLLLAEAELIAMTGGSPDEARKLIDRAVTAHPTSVRARLSQIGFAGRQRDPKAAVSAAQAAQGALPNDMQILEALGAAQVAAGNPEQAVETFQRAVQAQPQSPIALLRLAESQAAARDLNGAVISTRKALALAPTNASAWLLLAKLLLATGHPEQAITEAKKLEKDYPDKALGYAFEGEIWGLQRKFDEGAEAYRKAFAKEPLAIVAARLYSFLQNANKAAEASELADAWNRDHPKDPTMRVQAGQMAQMRNDSKAAMTHYKGALDIDPENVVVLNNMAWLLNQAKDPAAKDFAERAYRIAPFNPDVMDTLGWTLVNNNDVARGGQILKMASNLAPGNMEIRLHLGTAQARAGDKGGARSTLEPLTRLDAASPLRVEAEKTLSTL